MWEQKINISNNFMVAQNKHSDRLFVCFQLDSTQECMHTE